MGGQTFYLWKVPNIKVSWARMYDECVSQTASGLVGRFVEHTDSHTTLRATRTHEQPQLRYAMLMHWIGGLNDNALASSYGQLMCDPGARFTKNLTIYRKIIVSLS